MSELDLDAAIAAQNHEANRRDIIDQLRSDNDRLRQDNERLKGEVQAEKMMRQLDKRLLDTHKSCLEVATGALAEVLNSAVHPDKAIRSVMVPLDPIRATLHQINEVLGGDSTKTT